MTIRVRQVDKSLVESLLGRAQADYKAKLKKDIQLKVDPDTYLSPDTCGGIELIAAKGRIKVNRLLFYLSYFLKVISQKQHMLFLILKFS